MGGGHLPSRVCRDSFHGRQGLPFDRRRLVQDTRDKTVTKLAVAGCTVPQICAITGHDEASAYQILKHYLSPTGEMAAGAISKLVAHEEAKAEQMRAKGEQATN